MQIDVTKVLTDMQGDEIRCLEDYENVKFVDSQKTPEEQPFHRCKVSMTIRKCCVDSLLATTDKDKNIGGAEKIKRFKLAQSIQDNDSVELDSEQVTLLKQRIALMFGVIVVGKAYELLDPKVE